MNSLNFTNRRTLIALVVAAAAIALAGWWITSRRSGTALTAVAESRKIAHHQCPMHPWVKSDKPGKCTVCGMDLVSVYEGAGQTGAAATDIVMLPEGAPNVASIKTAAIGGKIVRVFASGGVLPGDTLLFTMDQPPDELSSKLKSWNVGVEIPARFQAGVWQRIAAREETRSRSLWRRVRVSLLSGLSRPAYATALLIVSISLSLGVAHVQAQSANVNHWRELEMRYVRSITPVPNPST